MGIVALALGITAMVFWWIPGLAVLLAATAVILGVLGKKEDNKYAKVAIVFGIVSFVVSLVWSCAVCVACNKVAPKVKTAVTAVNKVLGNESDDDEEDYSYDSVYDNNGYDSGSLDFLLED